MFASVEHVRDDLARVECCVPFRPVAEYKAFEENNLKNGSDDKRDVDENARSRSLAGIGGWEDESREDDPEADSDEQEGALND